MILLCLSNCFGNSSKLVNLSCVKHYFKIPYSPRSLDGYRVSLAIRLLTLLPSAFVPQAPCMVYWPTNPSVACQQTGRIEDGAKLQNVGTGERALQSTLG